MLLEMKKTIEWAVPQGLLIKSHAAHNTILKQCGAREDICYIAQIIDAAD